LRPSRRALDVADFTHEVGARWVRAARKVGVRLFEVLAPDSGRVVADPTLTRRILDNLLENALRHSPSGRKVRLTARPDHGHWLFEVADEGPGVPAAYKEHIFDRFVRVDSSRRRVGDGGTGLGLSVSKALASGQEADLSLVDGNGTGAIFQLKIPFANGADDPGSTSAQHPAG
jgi:signal transduction histidine kinase